MPFQKGTRLCWSLVLLGGSAMAQCYDLTSAQIRDVKGRFQEHWDKPIWDAKPGEGNFRLDEAPWFGGVPEFQLFAIGRVEKTDSGWAPFTKSRVPESWCEVGGPARNSYWHCVEAPYEAVPPGAILAPPVEYDRETWSLTPDGLLRFTRRTHGNSPIDQAVSLGDTLDAVLNLNTGAYSVIAHGHSKGHYTKRIPAGVELWRDTDFSARVTIPSEPCPAPVRRVALLYDSEKAQPVPICVARMKPAGVSPPVEFVLNPRKVNSPQGCVQVDDNRPSSKAAKN
jgi:hypothetical protein